MSALTLPGDIPGLLRRGSPVVLATRTYGGSVFLDGARGVVCSDGGRVGTETLGGSPVLVSTSPRDLALDLTDATGRAHAAWWAMGLDYGHIRPLRHIGSPVASARAVALYGSPQDAGWASSSVSGHPVGTIVPALAGLDPDDPRILPDGSRWVDAEALRLVCLHVAGRAP